MKRWIGLLAVAGCVGVICDGPVEAKDRSMAKSLIRTGSAIQPGNARACARRDLLGNWELVAFDSPYRFRNPQAPYLYPHQVFQYSIRGAVKSAHSPQPILGKPDTIFEAVPVEMTYQVDRRGLLLHKVKGQDQPVERWSCERVGVGELAEHDRGEGGAGRRGQQGRGRGAPHRHPPANSTAVNAPSDSTASAGPSTPNARPSTAPSIKSPDRAGPPWCAGSGARRRARGPGSRSVPMSRARTCSTPRASGSCPPDSAQTTNGVSSATLSVRW